MSEKEPKATPHKHIVFERKMPVNTQRIPMPQ